MIKLEDVSKIYQVGDSEVRALDHASLHVKEGEFVSIIGPSGSGKSTMMNIIGCLDMADSGHYYLDGQAIEEYTESELAKIRNRKIGFIFQSFNLIGNMTAEENVELPLIYQKIPKPERKARVEAALERVQLKSRAGHKPNELSGGQQQRVAIARALALSPDILCFDEPTSALDPELTGEVLKVIRGLAEENTTMLIVTHEMAFARDVADQVIFMDNGMIVECGDAKQVIDAPREERTRKFLARYADGAK